MTEWTEFVTWLTALPVVVRVTVYLVVLMLLLQALGEIFGTPQSRYIKTLEHRIEALERKAQS